MDMEKKFHGKTLLMLGSNLSAADSVRYARDNGAYVIVADWNETEKSKAKQFANEAILLSTADFDALSDLIVSRNVSGVFAGISGFNLKQAMKLCDKHSLPFYFSLDQWNRVGTKGLFRELCLEYGVPCPVTYYIGNIVDDIDWDRIEYPAVVKPVDGSSSAGVCICKDRQTLIECAKKDLELSASGKIIVEQFVKGDEFTAHYTVHEGRATLSCVDNRYPVAVHSGDVTTVPVARIYPSLFTVEYIDQVNEQMVALCESLGLSEGVLFVQGLYDGESFAIFEAGLRSAGECAYRLLDAANGVNYLHMLVDYALGVKTDYDTLREDPFFGGTCCGVVSYVGRGGEVGSILGLDETLKTVSSIIDYEVRYPVGSEIPDGDTLRQLAIRFAMCCESREQMAADIRAINESVRMLDVNGNDMSIKMVPERVFGSR